MFIQWGKPDGTVAITTVAPGMRLVRSAYFGDQFFSYDPAIPLEHVIGLRDPAQFKVEWAETEAECAARLVPYFQSNTEVVRGASVLGHEKPNLPYRLRKAWRYADGKLTIDVSAARQALLAELRAKRDDLLNESDRLQSIVTDIGTAAQKKDLRDYRQSLRDLPASISSQLANVADVDQLAAWKFVVPEKPSSLPG